MRHHGFGLSKSIRVATNHNRKDALFRPCLPTGNRRIKEGAVPCFGGCIKFTCDFRRSGCVVNEDGVWLQRLKSTAQTKRNRAQIVVITNASKNKVGIFCCVCGRGGHITIKLSNPRLSFGGRAIVNRYRMGTFRSNMSGHGKPHHAKTNPRDFAHLGFPHPALVHRQKTLKCAVPT
jgi:hypothetical protein